MKNSPTSRWLFALVLGVITSASAGFASDGARDEYRRAAIYGVWDSTVTLQVCGVGTPIRSFRALNSFAQGGALVATSEAAQQPSLGTWRWLGGRSFVAQFRFQRFDASGALLGFTEVTREIAVDANRQAFSSVASIRQLDLQGVEIGRGCALEAAQRVF
jgi:hypothetical protein